MLFFCISSSVMCTNLPSECIVRARTSDLLRLRRQSKLPCPINIHAFAKYQFCTQIPMTSPSDEISRTSSPCIKVKRSQQPALVLLLDSGSKWQRRGIRPPWRNDQIIMAKCERFLSVFCVCGSAQKDQEILERIILENYNRNRRNPFLNRFRKNSKQKLKTSRIQQYSRTGQTSVLLQWFPSYRTLLDKRAVALILCGWAYLRTIDLLESSNLQLTKPLSLQFTISRQTWPFRSSVEGWIV